MPSRRHLLFAMLYFCEGAPIGFLWWALPAHWANEGLPVERIATIAGVLVLPWSVKWLWAPLVDLSSARWPYRRWIVAAQALMATTLLALPWLEPEEMFGWLLALLLLHAFAAATQDVAIDAMCIATVGQHERGSVNGWMQAGMLLGRALFGGGALLVIAQLSLAAGCAALAALLCTAAVALVVFGPPPKGAPRPDRLRPDSPQIESPPAPAQPPDQADHSLGMARILRDPRTWLAFAFALLAGSAFESVGALLGPFLVDSGLQLEAVGMYQLGPLAGALAFGALLGGRLADRFGHVRMACLALLAMVSLNVALGATELASPGSRAGLQIIVAQYAVVGVFTASSYALFMDLAAGRWKATLFSAFMGATNACEAASAYASGQLVSIYGYPQTFIIMIVPSLFGLFLLWRLRPRVL